MTRLLAVLVASILICMALAAPAEQPKLLVLVVFDQMRGDYIERWRELFDEGGFKRLQTEGVWFTNCHYPYANTMTGPGHASILSGCSANRHGIIANEWWERGVGQIYCAGDLRYNLVQEGVFKNKSTGGGTPERMAVPTFADALRNSPAGRGKVVGVSLKDRSAAFPTGKTADACYWADSNTGQFCTSTFYRPEPHGWVTEFNRRRLADQWMGKTWDRFRPELNYEKYSGPDDMDGEATGIQRKQGRVFPHPFLSEGGKPSKDYYDSVEASPMGNELLLEFAKAAIVAEKLGQTGKTDLLTVSFSSNDLIGHMWGPDSQEVLDVTLRSDAIVKRLLDFLDEKVGKGKYLLAMTADHGICPVPEVSLSKGRDAHRIQPAQVVAAIEQFLAETYQSPADDKVKWLDSFEYPWVYLNLSRLKSLQLDADAVSTKVAQFLATKAGIQAAYTRKQIESASDDRIVKMLAKAYFPARAGEIAVVVKPYWLITEYASGTTHGSPHPYDTHVPLCVIGPGVPAGACDESVTPQAAALIFSQAAGVAPLPTMDAKLPDRLRR